MHFRKAASMILNVSIKRFKQKPPKNETVKMYKHISLKKFSISEYYVEIVNASKICNINFTKLLMFIAFKSFY